MSLPLAIQDILYVVLFYGLEHPAKMEEKLSQHDIASCTAKTHQLVCWQASISVNWAVGGVCKFFACLLGSYRNSVNYRTACVIGKRSRCHVNPLLNVCILVQDRKSTRLNSSHT